MCAHDDISAALLDIDAVIFPEEHVNLGDDVQSPTPIYIDNRLLISFPEHRRNVTAGHVALAKEALPFEAVAGVATAGIPWASWVASALDLPLLYVRPQSKEYGLANAVEGIAAEHANVLLVEDIICLARGALIAAEHLRNAGYQVSDVVTNVNYTIPVAQEKLEMAGLRPHWLTTVPEIVDLALERSLTDEARRSLVRRFIADPDHR